MALSKDDCRLVLGMVARGDNRYDIAAWFGIDLAEIAEVEDGDHGEPAGADELLPRGSPGIKARRLYGAVGAAMQALNSNNKDEALKQLKSGIEGYRKSE